MGNGRYVGQRSDRMSAPGFSQPSRAAWVACASQRRLRVSPRYAPPSCPVDAVSRRGMPCTIASASP
eukprot:1476327-Prymnesium_polylepis.1